MNCVALAGDATTVAGLWKELSTRVPVTVPTEKLKERDDAHALLVVGLRTAADASDEYRLEVIRLQEEVNRLRKADEEQQAEVVVLRRDGEDLKAKLEEQADAHAKSAEEAKEHEDTLQKLVGDLVAEAEHVDQDFSVWLSAGFFLFLVWRCFLTL